MPNGKPHDHPISDMLIHGMHPFPTDIEALLLDLYGPKGHAWDELGLAPFDWEEGTHLDAARELLRSLIASRGDPVARHRHIETYQGNTMG